MCWKILADWLVAIGTLTLAVVAIFQDKIRGFFYRPEFTVRTSTERPHCVLVPTTSMQTGLASGDRIYLRVWVMNVGNAAAKNVEIYAKELRSLRADGKWEVVKEFPPMNLKWADLGTMYWPLIAPQMGKHCDIAHIHDPERRAETFEESKRLGLAPNQASMTFDLITSPNHMGHIVGPGTYELDILVAAQNAEPYHKTVKITLKGDWDPDETTMLRKFVGIEIL